MTVKHCRAEDFVDELEDSSVSLLLTDPPYYGIVSEEWDNAWHSSDSFVRWLSKILISYRDKLTDNGSLIVFAGIGKHGIHPIFGLCEALEEVYTFRNWITWKKRRAYGKSHDYLFCREEILWFSKSDERTDVTFNVPLLDEKRGYAGFNEKYPAKSEYKRVSNVWDDIPELMRPIRSCEKPIPLLSRLILTHTNEGDLVVDPFAGTGSCMKAALIHKRKFLGCDTDPLMAKDD